LYISATYYFLSRTGPHIFADRKSGIENFKKSAFFLPNTLSFHPFDENPLGMAFALYLFTRSLAGTFKEASYDRFFWILVLQLKISLKTLATLVGTLADTDLSDPVL